MISSDRSTFTYNIADIFEVLLFFSLTVVFCETKIPIHSLRPFLPLNFYFLFSLYISLVSPPSLSLCLFKWWFWVCAHYLLIWNYGVLNWCLYQRRPSQMASVMGHFISAFEISSFPLWFLSTFIVRILFFCALPSFPRHSQKAI